tara:strand:- start:1412 stop:2005 length:594 start_codon:yes stop_codon:yes gene_type:complete
MVKISLIAFQIFFITSNLFSIELFGYKLYDEVYQYQNDGNTNYKKDKIENIVINEDQVLISNKYLNQYIIKSTKNGSIFEIHGSNNQLNMSPVECLDIQNKFITSFEDKNADLFFTEIKQFPNKLKSKTTWEIYLQEKNKNNEIIFSVTCDYSFNNRRMDIILSDINFLKEENKIFEEKLNSENQISEKKSIDTSGI